MQIVVNNSGSKIQINFRICNTKLNSFFNFFDNQEIVHFNPKSWLHACKLFGATNDKMESGKSKTCFLLLNKHHIIYFTVIVTV